MEMTQQSVLSSFLDELEKISASTREISRAAARLEGIYDTASASAALRKQNPDVFDAVTHNFTRQILGPAYYLPRKQPKGSKLEDLAGQIVITESPDALARQMSLPPKTKRGKKALRDTVLLHEGFERRSNLKTKYKSDPDYIDRYGHESEAGVIVPELNLINTLTGPGSEEVYRTMLKERSGELGTLRKRIRDLYGERALQFIERGQKIPKAMRKALERERRRS